MTSSHGTWCLETATTRPLRCARKIGSSERSDQLARYWQIIAHQYPGWRAIGLYLTPDGEVPSLETYLPVDYGLVCTLLEQLTQSRTSTLGVDVLTAIRHYTQMLRRHVVAESEIAELCRRIYRKHQRALDLQPDVIYLLTDGDFAEDVAGILRSQNTRGVPIHTICIGNIAGERQLREIARQHNGSYKFVQ
jgi:hypothetical protein